MVDIGNLLAQKEVLIVQSFLLSFGYWDVPRLHSLFLRSTVKAMWSCSRSYLLAPALAVPLSSISSSGGRWPNLLSTQARGGGWFASNQQPMPALRNSSTQVYSSTTSLLIKPTPSFGLLPFLSDAPWHSSHPSLSAFVIH